MKLASEPQSALLRRNAADAAEGKEDVTRSFRVQFGHKARDPAAFDQMLRQVFGNSHSSENAESLRQQALADDYSWLPAVEFVPAGVLGGAQGAYNQDTDTIYIDRDLRGTATAEQVFIEEAGHHIDTLVQTRDTQGDEGALFNSVLQDRTLTLEQFQELRAENDHGRITIDGQTLDVEFRLLEGDVPARSRPTKRQLESEEPPYNPGRSPEPQASTPDARPQRSEGGGNTGGSRGGGQSSSGPGRQPLATEVYSGEPRAVYDLTLNETVLNETEEQRLEREAETARDSWIAARRTGRQSPSSFDPTVWEATDPHSDGAITDAYAEFQDAAGALREHREGLVQSYVDQFDENPAATMPAPAAAGASAELRRLNGELDIDDSTVIDVAETMANGVAVDSTNLPQFLFPTRYQALPQGQTTTEIAAFLEPHGLKDSSAAIQLYEDRELQTGFTMERYFRVYDNPNGGTDGKSLEEDIIDLASGNYVRADMAQRLIDDYGVTAEDTDAVLEDIELAARELRENDDLRKEIDVGNASDKTNFDYEFRDEDVRVWVMNASSGTTNPAIERARQDVIDRYIDENNHISGGQPVAELVAGESSLGTLSETEQDHAINEAIDTWLVDDSAVFLDQSPVGELIWRLRKGDDVDLFLRATAIYTDRAIALMTPADGNITSEQRRDAATLAGTAMYELATVDNTTLQADYINSLDDNEIHALVDSLSFNDTSNLLTNPLAGIDRDTRIFSATTLMLNLEGAPRTEQTDEFTRTVFFQLQGSDYHQNGIEDRFAEVLTSNWTGTGESQQAAEARVAEVLRTGQGRDLLGYNANIPASDRLFMLSLFKENTNWDAELLGSHDGNGWTHPTVMEAYATPIVQDYVDLRGDTPVALEGEALENTIGFSVGLSPDEGTGNSATDIFNGDVNAFADQGVIIDPIAASIRDISGSGNTPEVTVLPVIFSDGNSPPRTVPLFRVMDGENERYVDASGGKYDSFAEWEAESEMPPGNRTYAADGHLTTDENGVVELTSNNTPNTIDTNWEHVTGWLDTGATIGGLVAGGVLIVGSAGTATPFVVGVAVAAGGWSTYRAGDRLLTSHDRGRDLNPLTNAEARGDWLDFSAGVLSLGSGAGRGLNLLTGSARGSGFVKGLTYAAEGADALATGNDAHTLLTQWDSLGPDEKALLALSIAFWGAENAGPRSQGPAASIEDAASIDADGNVTANPLAHDAADWIKTLDDGGTVPEFISMGNYVASARSFDGGLNTLVENARANGRLNELLDSGQLTRDDLQYLSHTDSIDVNDANRAIESRNGLHPDADESTLTFTDAEMAAFNLAANSALPNTSYQWGNYTWTTDEFGRTRTVEGEIELDVIGRNDDKLQARIGNELGFEYDVGFHIIADRFGAPVNRLNVVSGNGARIPGDPEKNLNGSAYIIFENQMAALARAAENDPDLSPPEVRISLEYSDGNTSTRPDEFVVEWRIDGGIWRETTFENKFEAPASTEPATNE